MPGSALTLTFTFAADLNRGVDADVQWAGETTETISFPVEYRELDTDFGQIEYIGGCTIHGSPPDQLGSTTISLNTRDDWYTAEPRDEWEACSDDDDGSYLCSKIYDLQETMTHELLHGYGLRHPSEVDDHLGTGTAAYDLANCGSSASRASICAGGLEYTTNRRVTVDYDHESLIRNYTRDDLENSIDDDEPACAATVLRQPSVTDQHTHDSPDAAVDALRAQAEDDVRREAENPRTVEPAEGHYATVASDRLEVLDSAERVEGDTNVADRHRFQLVDHDGNEIGQVTSTLTGAGWSVTELVHEISDDLCE